MILRTLYTKCMHAQHRDTEVSQNRPKTLCVHHMEAAVWYTAVRSNKQSDHRKFALSTTTYDAIIKLFLHVHTCGNNKLYIHKHHARR